MSSGKKKVMLGVVAVVCALACLVGGYLAGYQQGYGAALDPDKNQDESTADEKNDKNSDKEEQLSEDVISVLCCGVDNTQKLTDVIMYAQFDIRHNTVNILRIPRDTFVGSEFPTAKINAVYGHPYDDMDGIDTLKSYLEENWLLDIDYYATINLAGVRDIVDDMGGITMDIQQQINYLPGKVLYPGEQTLDGEQAEWILRYRSGYANGDLGRIDAQTQFLAAAIDRVHELGIMKCVPILMEHYKDIETDMPLNKMISVAKALYSLELSDMEMHVVPGEGVMYYSYAVYEADKEALIEILNDHFTLSAAPIDEENLQVAQIHSAPKHESKPQYQQPDYQQPQYQQPEYAEPENEEPKKENQIYQYDEQGRPLYRLDENGDPIYDYDADGNIIYIYEQAFQQEEPFEEENQRPFQEEEPEVQDTGKEDKESGKKYSSPNDKKPVKPKKNEEERKPVISKKDREERQKETD